MLITTTSGYSYSHKRCVNIVEWFVDEYLSRYNIDINVHHCRLVNRESVYGWVWSVDCDYRPREFDVEIHNQMSVEDYTKTLLHELWHVYQHVKGLLKDKYGKRLWKGVDHSEVDYSDQPWEQEAHKMEEVLYEKYRTSQL
tara:strand:+ start:328 stop:750 length:423 start_codon:yes stop_codon:yes gene_type:complete